jgi:hypothetical protein
VPTKPGVVGADNNSPPLELVILYLNLEMHQTNPVSTRLDKGSKNVHPPFYLNEGEGGKVDFNFIMCLYIPLEIETCSSIPTTLITIA